ncbi:MULTISPECIES: acetyl-CoA hydrolase/transferase family protein [unclassified Imperialibacter]|uniref:acetyl-CoA hydrolase/transferase family protein n=1 Tax=unclassified Imperialibacter TaxID=2629706 RepID=UPI0012510194|nr:MULTISPECIES: acetyl-CoA hydrolase/transferase C-terminal domain-containing protein [unclassified Imperialibacter]CAD5256695.1 4-hydroxybutyrate coenzyme A transferase [Imperialibacter sp. 75]CAD5259547.1 4-hydroxybutyrate coenzyme A transferase [Imperialibacter sp. 89]VVT26286.1 4-hydroxybutyrate coenzyme A transferase [Imperialibacter sp. EC-SDR9]
MERKVVSAEEALKVVKSNDRVFVHSVAAAPKILIDALVAKAPELRNVEIMHLHTEGPADYAKPEYASNFHVHSLFVGANVRKATQEHRADYIPIFLSEIPRLFREKILPIDVALVSVTPPDKHGYCSLGVSVDATLAAIETAKVVIAQVNPLMPRTFGDSCLPVSKFHYLVDGKVPIHEVPSPPISEVEKKIGQHIAGMVEDGATLQMGIGAIPNAVLSQLTNHKHLGIHTEMFSDGVVPLVESGVIDGSMKAINRGKIVSTFVMGSKLTYDFIDNNPSVNLYDVAFVNDVATIRRNPKVTSINSAIEIDITGQVCADSIGTLHYSGVGGQMDFIRGASYSKGGKPIIALPSVTGRGESKIVPFLKEGAGVVTTRAHVHYIVTEWGVAYLYGKTLHQRARLLIDIAHPDHREALERKAFERFGKI